MPFLYIWPILLLFKNFNNITSFFIKVHYFSLLLFLFFFCQTYLSEGKILYLYGTCVFPSLCFEEKRDQKKKFLLFFLYCDMLLCKRFRQKFTIYFIMISDKKNCDMYCTILVNIFCIEVWKIGTESSLFFYIL